MKKRLTTLIVSVLLMISASLSAQVSTWDGSWEPWTNGTGTEDDPFLIENARQLAYLAYRVNNGLDANGTHISNHDYHYKLMVDVNLNGSENFQWTPIGYWNSDTDYQCFGGHFDGNDHAILNIYINSSADRVGVWGYVHEATVLKLSLNGNIISTLGTYAGGIIGVADGATIIKDCSCILINGMNASANVGGIVGRCEATSSKITNCYNTGNLTTSLGGNRCCGGILGYGHTVITNCYNTGSVAAIGSGGNIYHNNNYSGGIVGYGSAQINNCYNMGNVIVSGRSNLYSGGIKGYGGNTISNCYSIGDITGGSCGGIVGYTNGQIYNSYFLSTCGGNNTYGGQQMSSDAMQSFEFVDILNDGTCAWDYDSNNINQGYPVLSGNIIVVSTADATDVTQSHATLQGLIEVDGILVQSQGFKYKKSTDSSWQIVSVSGYGNISTTLSNLTHNTQYVYCAFCTPNECGTAYGEEKIFTTQSISVATNNASDVTQAHATLNGTINSGDANISSQGFEYKKSSDNEWQSVSVSGSGDIAKTLSDLTPGTQYRFRTFCTPEGCETVYGQEKMFNTLAISVTTNNATYVTQTHATLHGAINTGDANISSQGFEYKKASDNVWQTISVSGNGEISQTLSGLNHNTQYSFRAFCTPQGGETVYGQEKSFNTLAITVSTNYATNVTQTHATLEGNVNTGDANVWAGFEYKTQGTSWQTVNVSGSGNITKTLSNLIPNTHYIYRTFCSITENGTIYGEEREFTTMNVYAATDPATEIDNNSAVLHGFVNIGDATLINKGFEYYLVNPSVEGPFVVYVTDENYDFSAELEGLNMFSNGGSMYMYKTFVTIAEKEGTIYGNDEVFSWYDAREILVYDMDMMFSIAGACYNGETFENKTIILLNNIEFPVASENFISIGSYPDNPFRGTFYGNGKTISNLALGQTNMHYQGLFGYTQGAMISSLMLDNVNIYGRNYCGGIVAYADNTFIYESCIVNSSINALNYCGGIVGYVEGENTDVMGCYSTCNVSGNNYVGGLVGNSNIGAVRNSYAAGSVSGHGNAVGGILGGAHETLMINCYFNTDITGQSVAIGENYFKDGEGVTTTQMRMPQFVATMNQGITPAIWIADNIPYINNGFPILYWQTSGGESCGAPQNLSHSISGNQITLNWAIVDEADYYIVKYATINGIEHTQVTEQNSFTFNAVQDSTYSWRVKSVCPNGESVFVNGNNVGLGVDENDAVSNHLMLYPNPANELVTIKLDDVECGLNQIRVFDVSGREVLSANASGQEYNLNVSGLLKGIYFIRVITEDDGVANLKLVVK